MAPEFLQQRLQGYLDKYGDHFVILMIKEGRMSVDL